jgi:hypothetical protein
MVRHPYGDAVNFSTVIFQISIHVPDLFFRQKLEYVEAGTMVAVNGTG